jgi:hypothetical protein
MVFVPPKDRVLEASTSNSQSVFALTGAADASFNRFSAFMSVGDTTIGAVVEPGVAYKSGVLIYSNANEITVGTAFESKGTFSAAGTKQVFTDLPAAAAMIAHGACEAQQDLNLLTAPGTYYTVDTSTTNGPPGVPDLFMIEVQSMAASFAGDFGQRALGLTTGATYTRTCVGNTWGAWKEAGSGVAATMAQLLAGTPSKIPDSQIIFQLLIADSLIQNNATDPTNDIDVLLNGVAVVTKRLDANWTAGTNAGGLDTGTKANSATYHVFLLRKDSDGSLDAIFSVQPINPTVPTGYTKVRVLGAVMTGPGGVIRRFLQSGDRFTLLNAQLDLSAAANPLSPPSLRTITVPQGVKVVARCFFAPVNSAGAGGYIYAWDADLGPSASGHRVMERLTGATENGLAFEVMTNANCQIYTNDDSSGSPLLTIQTQGWTDPRVRRHAI